MNLRLEALKLAVASQGNPNKLGLAKEYLEFLEAGETVTTMVTDTMAYVSPKSREARQAAKVTDHWLACLVALALLFAAVYAAVLVRTRRLTKQTDLGAPFAGNF
jgi:hypothetical protein